MSKSKQLKAKVYLEQINYLGEVNDSVLIAEFKNVSWAEEFVALEKYYREEDELWKWRIEEVN